MEKIKNLLGDWKDHRYTIIFNFFLLMGLLILGDCLDRSVWHPSPFLLSFAVLFLPSLIDWKTYANLTTWFIFFPPCYVIWWFLFNLPF